MRTQLTIMTAAVGLATAASAHAQEYYDQVILDGAATDVSQQVGAIPSDIVDDPIVEEEADGETVSAVVDPEILREELTALIKLPVRDVDEKRIGVVENVVMKDGAPHLVIIKLDNLIPSDRLLRAIPSAEAVTVEEGAAVALATLTKTKVRKQSAFFYEDAMDTLVPVTKAAERSDQQSES